MRQHIPLHRQLLKRIAEALWTWALRIAARRGKHVAVVALARRLAGILYALLRDGTVYAPRGPAALPDSVAALHA